MHRGGIGIVIVGLALHLHVLIVSLATDLINIQEAHSFPSYGVALRKENSSEHLTGASEAATTIFYVSF